MNEVEQMLVTEMTSEDHLENMMADDLDGALIDAVIDGTAESIFSDPEDDYDYDEEEEDDE